MLPIESYELGLEPFEMRFVARIIVILAVHSRAGRANVNTSKAF